MRARPVSLAGRVGKEAAQEASRLPSRSRIYTQRVTPIQRAAALLVAVQAAALCGPAACRKSDRPRLPSVGGLQTRLAPRFAPPVNGEITPSQVDLYLR